MAYRPFLHLGDNICKCVFTTAQFKPKIYAIQGYTQIRNFSKLTKNIRLKKTSLSKRFNKQEGGHVSNIWKPLTFTIMFSGATFIGAVIWEYEGIRERTHRMISSYKQWGLNRTGWRHEMEIWWKSLSEGEKIFVPICFLNVLVFLSWHIPAFQVVMNRYFCNSLVNSTLGWPLLLSAFSHCSFYHLIINMYVLYSFSTIAVDSLGKEQFVALYLISGVVANFAGYLYKAVLSMQNPSLGASGALMGILGYVCTEFPNIYLSFVFLPMFKFTSTTAINTMIGMDTLGCILRWQYLDHAAHLGGVLFGIFWQAWGNANIWQKREPVLMFWHQLRESSKSR